MVYFVITQAIMKVYVDINRRVQDLFVLDRESESEKFASSSHAHSNRQLLWHGSRLTNYVGILSQGLRIAPPEAPATGVLSCFFGTLTGST
jgi:poly [ADP-ribose] polymerase